MTFQPCDLVIVPFPLTIKTNPINPLREDLTIIPGPIDSLDSHPTWIIHDAVRHRFYRIGRRELHMLNHWQRCTTIQALQHHLNTFEEMITPEFSIAEIVGFSYFLQQNQLTTARNQPLAAPKKPGWLTILLSHYLFFRIPLFTPDSFLKRLLPWVQFFFSPWTAPILWSLGLLAVLATSQQWDRFIGTIPEVFDTQGAITLALAVFLTKLVHELGHALTAKRFGINVPTMGVAFLVMWPVLYTELSEVWKLPSRQQRLAITAAGIKAELGLAIVATLLWTITPDGNLREALFLLATTTWVTTLLFNLSPFMRFDGYFLVCDWLDIPNLHPRAFAMGRWWLRRLLLGIRQPPPEPWSAGPRLFLILFAITTWIYRFLLYVSIALVVYHFFFKLLGILLLIVELAWFILRPILKEFGEWVILIKNQPFRASASRVAGMFLLVTTLLLYPWHVQIQIPALLRPERLLAIYPPQEARIEQILVEPGRYLEKGSIMARLDAPFLDLQLELSRSRATVFQRRLELGATSLEYLENQASLSQQLAQERVRLEGWQNQRDKLTLVAPIAGRVVMVMDHLHEGRWVGTEKPLLTLASPHMQVHGYIGEADLERVIPDSDGWFYPTTPEVPPIRVHLQSVALTDSRVVDLPELASVYNGPIPTTLSREGKPLAKRPIYRTILSLIDASPRTWDRVHPGLVMISGGRESLWTATFTWITAQWIRESSF